MKRGRCNVVGDSFNEGGGRLSELARRNSLYPAHLQSSYAPETQYLAVSAFSESDLRRGSLVNLPSANKREEEHDVRALTDKTAKLGMDSPAANTRSRRRTTMGGISAQVTQEKPNKDLRPSSRSSAALSVAWEVPAGTSDAIQNRKKATPTRGRQRKVGGSRLATKKEQS